MAPRRKARIAFGYISPPPLPGTVSEAVALRQAIVTGSSIERYGRVWRMGPSSASGNGAYLTGRLGFERAGGVNELWDEARQDFVERVLYLGTATPFSIRLSDLRVAFQRRPGIIERQSFAGALQDLLNESSSYSGWRVQPETDPVALAQFLVSVDRVSTLTVRVNRPNPHYGERARVQEIVEGSTSRFVTMSFAAQEGESVNVEEPLLSEAIEHVALSYGYLKAEGMKGPRTVKYDSRRDGVAPEVQVNLPATDHEASGEQVRSSLEGREDAS